MDLTVVISLAAILIAVFTLISQMRFESDMTRDKLRNGIRENRNAIRKNRDAIQSLNGRLRGVERGRIHVGALNSQRLSDAERERIYADALNSQRLSDAERERIYADALNSQRLSETEREQARLEGANRMMRDVILQKSRAKRTDWRGRRRHYTQP